MKKGLVFVFIVSLLTIACSHKEKDNDYLHTVYKNLDKIRSATYFSTLTSSYPGDTSKYFTFHEYVKEYPNPRDTFVGASFIVFNSNDTAKMIFCYDGNMRARVNWEEKYMEIDSFKNNPHPFRPVGAPFFTRIKRLLKYVFETNDSLSITPTFYTDSVKYSFIIYDTVVEIIGNKIVYTPSLYGSHKGDISKYTIWIDKKKNLPYKIKREMPHENSSQTCEKIILNKSGINDFIASSYFPNLPLKKNKNLVGDQQNLLGKKAPPVHLKDADNRSYSLKDFNSKVLLLEFTSVTCGPCQLSIPFLEKLSGEFDKDMFDIISIEAFTENPELLKIYKQKKNFHYKFFMSDKETRSRYYIQAVPEFFILDSNRIINKIIHGYRQGTTDIEITNAIKDLN